MPMFTFKMLERMAENQNCVLERQRRVVCGSVYNYEMWSNRSSVGGNFQTLAEVIEALTFDPCFQKD